MKIVVLTHLHLGKELINTCGFIMGGVEDNYYLGLDENGIEYFAEELKQLLQSFGDEEILFLCDLNHGSPHNQLLLYLMENQLLDKHAIITNCNLSVLLHANILRDSDLTIQEIRQQCLEAGGLADNE